MKDRLPGDYSTSTLAGHRDGLRNELIHDTVVNAKEGSSFYAELYDLTHIDVAKITSVSDLRQLPIVTKEQLRQADRAALCMPDSTRVSHIQHTTGTTGEPFFIYRSLAETQFIYDFYTCLGAAEPSLSSTPIMMQVQLPHHGTPTPVPANVFVIPFSVNDDFLLEFAILLLRKEFHLAGVDQRVSILSGSQTGILAITGYLLEQEIDCTREFQIRLIHLQGRYLTARWRRLLHEKWGAAISDKYSLAEVFGGAGWCRKCDGFHFEPHVVPELVDFTKKQPLEKGTGVLLLTSLYPFVQFQPMLRYWTGDIFSLDPSRCEEPSFYFLGRVNYALFNPDNPSELWLSGVDIIETLDSHPEINRTARFRDVTRVSLGKYTGRLRVRGYQSLKKGVHRLVLKIEVTPAFTSDDCRRMQDQIRMKLLARSENLSRAVQSGKAVLRVDCVEPGVLGSLDRFTQLWLQE